MNESHKLLQSLIIEILNTFFELREVGKDLDMVSESGGGLWGLMRILKTQGPMTLSEIARYRGVSRQYIQKIAAQLEKEGLLELIENPVDKRSKLLTLSEQGERRYQEMNQRFAQVVEQLLPAFDNEELNVSLEVVRTLKGALGDFKHEAH